ncbi:MAG TPA: hypothetical protein VKB46_19615, partial [Pyrinomonadaceae bacterium]|nr:hypothetical protein [Pyrinomonadaceae bacterium]
RMTKQSSCFNGRIIPFGILLSDLPRVSALPLRLPDFLETVTFENKYWTKGTLALPHSLRKASGFPRVRNYGARLCLGGIATN